MTIHVRGSSNDPCAFFVFRGVLRFRDGGLDRDRDRRRFALFSNKGLMMMMLMHCTVLFFSRNRAEKGGTTKEVQLFIQPRPGTYPAVRNGKWAQENERKEKGPRRCSVRKGNSTKKKNDDITIDICHTKKRKKRTQRITQMVYENAAYSSVEVSRFTLVRRHVFLKGPG